MKDAQHLNRLQAQLERFHYHSCIPTITDRPAASQEKVGRQWFPKDQRYQKQDGSLAVPLRLADPNTLGSDFATQCSLWPFSMKKSLASLTKLH